MTPDTHERMDRTVLAMFEGGTTHTQDQIFVACQGKYTKTEIRRSIKRLRAAKQISRYGKDVRPQAWIAYRYAPSVLRSTNDMIAFARDTQPNSVFALAKKPALV